MFMLLAGPARGSMSAGEFLTFNTSVTMLLTSVTQLTGALLSAAAVLPMYEQVKPILDEAPEVRGGSTISGGQRQRLMIAQALIRRPRVLFLDEATSALDNETQRTVIESTKALRATRVVIAHRLSTVLDADRVVVMEEGKVVQQGPPARLLAEPGGRLHELVRRQLA